VINVLLLEAGPPDDGPEISVPGAWTNLFKTECNWGYLTAPQMHLGGREVYFPRGKTLGGSFLYQCTDISPGPPC
jgi:choline dehydrogenase